MGENGGAAIAVALDVGGGDDGVVNIPRDLDGVGSNRGLSKGGKRLK
jgi:hypothetical protein